MCLFNKGQILVPSGIVMTVEFFSNLKNKHACLEFKHLIKQAAWNFYTSFINTEQNNHE